MQQYFVYTEVGCIYSENCVLFSQHTYGILNLKLFFSFLMNILYFLNGKCFLRL